MGNKAGLYIPIFKRSAHAGRGWVVPIEIEAESITVTSTSKHMDIYDVLDLSYEILPKNAADTLHFQ